jgi:putative transposase
MAEPKQYRKRLRRYERSRDVRFLTFSCFRRLQLLGNDKIKDAFVEHLHETQRATNCKLYAWVVMPEHVHLLLTPDQAVADVPRILRLLKGAFAHRVLERWRELDAPILRRVQSADGTEHFWQSGGGYDRNIISEEAFYEKLQYIHNNPVRRGLVDRSEQWNWSSIHRHP